KVVAEKKVPQLSQMTEILICEIICEIGEICDCFSLIYSQSYVIRPKLILSLYFEESRYHFTKFQGIR
ncbi:MAG: hypothetical protein SCK70_13705, partial [bacterium]|nr:hypothetical protein [bacterium]